MQNEGRTLWIRWEWVVGVVDVGAVECSLDDFFCLNGSYLYTFGTRRQPVISASFANKRGEGL